MIRSAYLSCVIVSACVIGHMQLNALRQKDGEKLSAIMSTRLQAYERGRQARMRWYAAIDEMKRMESPQRRSARASSPTASRRPRRARRSLAGCARWSPAAQILWRRIGTCWAAARR